MNFTRSPHRFLPTALILGACVLATGLSSAAPAGASSVQPGPVSLVAYSTPKPAYAVLAADFAKTPAGKGVTISQSFGPSGTQATEVVDGLHADVVNFSLSSDMKKLVTAGLVSKSWDQGTTGGI